MGDVDLDLVFDIGADDDVGNRDPPARRRSVRVTDEPRRPLIDWRSLLDDRRSLAESVLHFTLMLTNTRFRRSEWPKRRHPLHELFVDQI